MHQIFPDDFGFESSDCTVLLAEVVTLVGKKDIQDRELAFERLYKYYKQPIERYLVALVHDEEHAADLSQETFKRVWTLFRRLETSLPQTVNHLKNWLYKIASDVAIDDYRRKKSRDFLTMSDSEAYAQLSELVVEGEEERIFDRLTLQEAITQMPQQYQQCFLWSYYGYTYQEIAAKKGIAEKTVSANVSRGKAQLQSKIYPVTVDLQRAEALHARAAINNLLSGITGGINVGKLDKYEEKAREWRYREGDMKKHISEIRNDLLDGDVHETGFFIGLAPAQGVRSRSGLWVPNGYYARNVEELEPFNADGLHKPTKQRRTNAKRR